MLSLFCQLVFSLCPRYAECSLAQHECHAASPVWNLFPLLSAPLRPTYSVGLGHLGGFEAFRRTSAPHLSLPLRSSVALVTHVNLLCKMPSLHNLVLWLLHELVSFPQVTGWLVGLIDDWLVDWLISSVNKAWHKVEPCEVADIWPLLTYKEMAIS